MCRFNTVAYYGEGCVLLMSFKRISQLKDRFKYVRIFRPFIMI